MKPTLTDFTVVRFLNRIILHSGSGSCQPPYPQPIALDFGYENPAGEFVLCNSKDCDMYSYHQHRAYNRFKPFIKDYYEWQVYDLIEGTLLVCRVLMLRIFYFLPKLENAYIYVRLSRFLIIWINKFIKKNYTSAGTIFSFQQGKISSQS